MKDFIQAKTRAGFDSALSSGSITQEQIAFIEDKKQIWARGNFYSSAEVNNEDISFDSENKLQLSDRSYIPEQFSGKGYKILRKNTVDGKNVLTQEMINEENTIYEVRYDFDLNGNTINIPNKCVITFKGGSFKNGIVNGNNTTVNDQKYLYCKTIGIFNNYINYNSSFNDKIFISNQNEFDELTDKINNGEEIDAIISDGTFVLKEYLNIRNNLKLVGSTNTIIKGNNPIFRRIDAVDKNYTHYICDIQNTNISEFSLFVDKNNNIINVSESVEEVTKVNVTTEDILYVDDNNIKIRIPDNLNHLKNKTFEKAFGYLDSWYTAPIFKLLKSDDSYFYCNTYITTTSENFNTFINGEKTYYSTFATFVIYNAEIKENYIYYDNSKLYIPKNIDFVECIINNDDYYFSVKTTSDINNISVENISFFNIGNLYYSNWTKTSSNLYINNCRFRNILGGVINSNGGTTLVKNIISNCDVKDCSLLEKTYVFLDTNSNKDSEFKVINCNICRNYNDVPVYKNCSGAVQNRDQLYVRRGIVNLTNNVLFNTDSFLKYPQRNASRDSGFIYVNNFSFVKDEILNNTNNIVTISYNKLYNVLGRGDVRGIFIDNGRGDVKCIGNVILSSQYYSIDARKYSSNPASSCRIVFEDNILYSKYRLEYNNDTVLEDNVPISKNNILLYGDNNKTTDVYSTDKRINTYYINNSDIFISKDIYNNIPQEVRKNVLLAEIPSKIKENTNLNYNTIVDRLLTIKIPLCKTGQQSIKINLTSVRYPYQSVEIIFNETHYTITGETFIYTTANFGNSSYINKSYNVGIRNYKIPMLFSNTDDEYMYIYYSSIDFGSNDIKYIGIDQFYVDIVPLYVSETFTKDSIEFSRTIVNDDNYEEVVNTLKNCSTIIFKNKIDTINLDNLDKTIQKIKEVFSVSLDGLIARFQDTSNSISATYIVKNNTLCDFNGEPRNTKYSGIFSQKPSNPSIGFAYFCTDKQTTEGSTNGIVIYHKGGNVWVDALGRVVE